MPSKVRILPGPPHACSLSVTRRWRLADSQRDPLRAVCARDRRRGDRISIFAQTGTLDLPVDPDALTEQAVEADLVAVTIFEHCRAVLAPLRSAGVALWIDVPDHDGRNPYHADVSDAASHLQLSSVELPERRR